ncbi:MAG: DUF502 domain-containing protein [Sphingobacteriales bacterium]|nr:MAG: DUF502 domain-containing protein [Sphingobacteriales bacterium]
MKKLISFRHLFPREPFRFKKIFQYFLQGLLIIAPVAVTGYAIYWVVSTIDGWIPLFTARNEEGRLYVRNFGLGFLIIIGTVCLLGYLSSFFIESRVFNLFDYWMEKTPGIKFIYSTVKDFFEAFAGEKKKFDKAVLANIDDNDVWRVGFITQQDMTEFGLKDYVAVYVPMSYSIAGNVYLIPSTRVKPITNISSTDAMKFAISGGITTVDESARPDKQKDNK